MSAYTPRHCAESRLRAALMRFLKRIDEPMTEVQSVFCGVFLTSFVGCTWIFLIVYSE